MQWQKSLAQWLESEQGSILFSAAHLGFLRVNYAFPTLSSTNCSSVHCRDLLGLWPDHSFKPHGNVLGERLGRNWKMKGKLLFAAWSEVLQNVCKSPIQIDFKYTGKFHKNKLCLWFVICSCPPSLNFIFRRAKLSPCYAYPTLIKPAYPTLLFWWMDLGLCD